MFDKMDPIPLIEEVKARPGLYRTDQPADREEKLALWKEVGAALFEDWPSYSKAMAYDRVLQLQKKWRSLRDAYNRELRSRKTGKRVNGRVYMHFKRLSFLGGYEGTISEEDEDEKPVVKPKRPRPRYKKQEFKETSSESDGPAEELEITIPQQTYQLPQGDGGSEDSDKLFLLSFLPEIRQLPPKIKMWARAKIARVMEEAVSSQYDEAGGSMEPIKTRRSESDD